jgi:hypothetical protein
MEMTSEIAMDASVEVLGDPMSYIVVGRCRAVRGGNVSSDGASMKNPNMQKMELSYAYIHAVSSSAGFICDRRSIDINSVDLTIRADEKISPASRILAVIDFQVKATSSRQFKNGVLSLPLPIKNYDELRSETSSPILLIAFEMPENMEDWLNHSEEQLITRKCAYWLNLRGLPVVDNDNIVTVHIKQKNVFSPKNLTELMLRASKNDGMGVGYEI